MRIFAGNRWTGGVKWEWGRIFRQFRPVRHHYRKRCILDTSYYSTVIGNHRQAIEWCNFRCPWVTHNPDFKQRRAGVSATAVLSCFTCNGIYELQCTCVQPHTNTWCTSLIMSPLRRHIFVCFMTKGGFFGPSSVKRGRTHIGLGWNM